MGTGARVVGERTVYTLGSSLLLCSSTSLSNLNSNHLLPNSHITVLCAKTILPGPVNANSLTSIGSLGLIAKSIPVALV